MTCEFIKTDDGVMILCSRTRRAPKCSVCGRPASRECDHPSRSGTCDKPLCEKCAVRYGDEIDYCPSHPAPVFAPPAARKQGELF